MTLHHARTIDSTRLHVSKQLDPARQSMLGQYMTPARIADFMAALFTQWPKHIRLLDPGAGIGSLTEAFARQFVSCSPAGSTLEADCYEIDGLLASHLAEHLDEIGVRLKQNHQVFASRIHDRDFIESASFEVGMSGPRFSHALLNPPYKKMGAHSLHRNLVRKAGLETVNLYTAFLGLSISMVKPGGEIVAIVPRSFCNGAYFRPFREFLLSRVAIRQIHVFESRTKAFSDDGVLQENIIIHAQCGAAPGPVTVSMSSGGGFEDFVSRIVPFKHIVNASDKELFIHIPLGSPEDTGRESQCTLAELGVEVSTGPVVDFRVKEHWLDLPEGECAPLLYAHHFSDDDFVWPKPHKELYAICLNPDTRKWLMPRGCYAITRRFSAKEERRRLVAHVIDPSQLRSDHYGFENHLNVFHVRKQGLDPDLAHGLALYLNTTEADKAFRVFSGHTQVNATDLRNMRYPRKEILVQVGQWARHQSKLPQAAIDAAFKELHA